MTKVEVMTDKPRLKILYGYSWFRSEAYGDVRALALAYFDSLNRAGFDVEPFCLTLDPPGPCLSFPELDRRWRKGDRALLEMYRRLEQALEGKDVFINGPGINLHPEYVESLPVFTVFQCFDDPESSANLSRPVAASYDLCLVGNIAEVDSYRSWGVKAAEWTPMGLQPTIYDAGLSYETILNGERDIDLFMMADRTARWRKDRLDQLAGAFPEAHFYGKGWQRGYLPVEQEIACLRRAKIGPNLHNSTGPINYRTFYLPANGVLQICDNKSHLGRIYQLDKEVVGFDTVKECIELCRYYLEHDQERREIAANGWRRAVTDYNQVAVFERALNNIHRHLRGDEKNRQPRARAKGATVLLGTLKDLAGQGSRLVSAAGAATRGLVPGKKDAVFLEHNVGSALLEWPHRLITALELVSARLPADADRLSVADYGCGKQTLRRLIPPHWSYLPFDYCKRSDDTVICDFNRDELPRGSFDLVFCMGVLEYLEDPLKLIGNAIGSSRYTVFSYNLFTTAERRSLQGWQNNLSIGEIRDCIAAHDARLLEEKLLDNNEWIYLVEREP